MLHVGNLLRAGPLDEAEHVMLVSSGGGHLSQLLSLRPWWESRERTWVTFDTEETRSRLAGERVVHAFHPTTRNLPNLARNTRVAARAVPRLCPDLLLSTGAGVAVPFFAVARALGLRTVYVEVFDRIDSATVTGRLCYPLSSLFLVQWPQQRRLYPKARVVGALI
jgi:UDP-N-acetylglucosamine:LPS N-acetylglucosamine transferase